MSDSSTVDPATRPRQTALITGASAGIGCEFARIFAADRYDVVLTARDGDRLNRIKSELEGLHGIEARVIVKDLSDPAAPTEIFEELENDMRIDVLVNNAGFGGFGLFTETDTDHQLRMIQVNITSLTHLTKLFLKDMVARKEGKILNVASTAAFQPGPFHSVYYATKAYVLLLSEAINNELTGTGVTVTAFCPGPTETEFFDRAGGKRSKLFRRSMTMTATTAAEIGYRGMCEGKPLVIPGFRNKLLAFSTRLLPRRLVTGMVSKIQSGVSDKLE
jgi:short-subunit dehydrogenase